jgi:hypothetical protein
MIGVERRESKVIYTIGFVSTFIGYSFYKCLWADAFYHLMAVSFVCYTYCFWAESRSDIWRKLTFIGFVACCNNLTDELIGEPCVFSYSEYISIVIISIYTFKKEVIKKLIVKFAKKLNFK